MILVLISWWIKGYRHGFCNSMTTQNGVWLPSFFSIPCYDSKECGFWFCEIHHKLLGSVFFEMEISINFQFFIIFLQQKNPLRFPFCGKVVSLAIDSGTSASKPMDLLNISVESIAKMQDMFIPSWFLFLLQIWRCCFFFFLKIMYHVHFSNQLAHFCWSLNIRFRNEDIFALHLPRTECFCSSLYTQKTQENMERLFAKCNTESENNSQPNEPNRSRNLLVSCLSFEMDHSSSGI